MNTDALRNTFAAHERLTPDADDVWRSIQTELQATDTHQRRTLVAVGAAATVAAIAAGALALANNTHDAHSTAPGSSTSVATSPSALTSSAMRTPIAFRDYLTMKPGWLPAGAVGQGVATGAANEFLGYLIGSGSPSTQINLTRYSGTALPTDYKRGTPQELTIGNRPAREWSVDGWYYLAIAEANATIVTVDVNAEGATAGSLRATGRRVAENLDLNAHVPVTPRFQLGYLPSPAAITSLAVDADGTTTYEFSGPAEKCMCDGGTVYMERGPETSGVGATGKPSAPTTPGRTVQGHRTEVVTGTTVPTLEVLDVVDGRTIVIQGGVGAATLASVYAIADGLILS
jgi:hypothetical protein